MQELQLSYMPRDNTSCTNILKNTVIKMPDQFYVQICCSISIYMTWLPWLLKTVCHITMATVILPESDSVSLFDKSRPAEASLVSNT